MCTNFLIAGKYKEYNKLRDILAGKIPYPPPPIAPASATSQTPRKRKREDRDHASSKRQILSKTPSKTPSKGELKPWEVDPYDTPTVVRSLFTPSKKALGPTPQKDGVVLGLFDLLEPAPTPQGKKSITSWTDIKPAVPITSTPRKPKEDVYEKIRHTRTPASASKRFLLDAFATPLKPKDFDAQTPSSVSKLHFNTPSFLRRDSQHISFGPRPQDGEVGKDISPQMVRVPRKPLVRGLSSILAGLRKIEEDAHDEELEALHEMEADEMSSRQNAKPKASTKSLGVPKDMVLVEDSQPNPTFPLGGFDDETQFDSEPEEADRGLGRDGKPLKVYKKKGQKRTTRRVKMKPSRAKPQAIPQTNAGYESESEDDVAEPHSLTAEEAEQDEAVAETQLLDNGSGSDEEGEEASQPFTAAARNYDSDTQSEWTASDGGTRRKRPNASRRDKRANADGRVKRAARKVTALANQNFKRLKLRNTGSKGGPGVGSRFRRKR